MLLFDVTPKRTKPSCMNKKMKICPHYIYETLNSEIATKYPPSGSCSHPTVYSLFILSLFPIPSRR